MPDPLHQTTSKEQELKEAIELHMQVMDEMEDALRHVREVIKKRQEEKEHG